MSDNKEPITITTGFDPLLRPGTRVLVKGTGPVGWRKALAWIKWFFVRGKKPGSSDGTYTVTLVTHRWGTSLERRKAK